MARKKKGGVSAQSTVIGGTRRMSVSLEEAENGFTVHASGEGKNGEYHSKNFIAPNERGAIRIATQHLSSLGKSKGKKGKKKKITLSKRG